jgi:hypothetical protein
MRRLPKLLEKASYSSQISRSNKTSIKALRKPKKLYEKVVIPDIFSTAVMVDMAHTHFMDTVMDTVMDMVMDFMATDMVLLTDMAMSVILTLQRY